MSKVSISSSRSSPTPRSYTLSAARNPLGHSPRARESQQSTRIIGQIRSRVQRFHIVHRESGLKFPRLARLRNGECPIANASFTVNTESPYGFHPSLEKHDARNRTPDRPGCSTWTLSWIIDRFVYGQDQTPTANGPPRASGQLPPGKGRVPPF